MLSATSNGGSPFAIFLPFVLLGGLFYFMFLRPQQRRAKEQQALINSVEVGDHILIAGAGIYGVVTSMNDEEGTVSVEIAPGTEITMLRGGIARRVVDEDEGYDDDDDGDDSDADTQDYPDQPGQIKEL